MSKVACIAKLTAQSGSRDDLIEALSDLLAAARDEVGTELYILNLDAQDEDSVWFYELYTDQDGLSAHSGSEAMKAAFGKLAGLLAGPPALHLLTPHGGKGIEV